MVSISCLFCFSVCVCVYVLNIPHEGFLIKTLAVQLKMMTLITADFSSNFVSTTLYFLFQFMNWIEFNEPDLQFFNVTR